MLPSKELLKLAKSLGNNFEIEKFKLHRSDFEKFIPEHLINNCSDLKSFYPILVSLEREFDKESLETDFLVTTTDQTKKTKINPVYFLLENIRSSFNVGSIFRTADSLGVTEIILTGYTSTPENPKTLKTSLGSAEKMNWRHFLNPLDAVKDLKSKGVKIYALETSSKAVSLKDFTPAVPFCLVVGNERFGLSSEILNECDEIISIPQFGIKNSLNVSVALGIAGYNLVMKS